jgi:glutamyl-tRNA(Gln) amidotransferase subunit D
MYSEKLQKMLEKLGISTGDSVVVEKEGMKIEGDLMPKTEAGDEDTLVVKMKSGYNAGVKFEKGVAIKKVSERKVSMDFPFANPEIKKGLPEITIIWTGGTIGSKINYQTSGVNSVAMRPAELLYYMPEIKDLANISITNLSAIMSEDLTFVEWQKMAQAVADAVNKGAKGVVIAHGTDTMHYTAAALSFMLGKISAPVIITGSQRSSDRGSSDAFLNFSGAVAAAARSNIGEVCICMHSSSSDDKLMLIRGTKARKMHASRRDAFRPINDRPIGFISHKGYQVSYASEYRKIEPGKITPKTKFEPKVAIVKAYPNSDPEIVEYYSNKGYKGIIIEATGLGHTPVGTSNPAYSWLSHVKKVIDDGLVVGITSQCIYGRVNETVYSNLRLLSKTGAVQCQDMTTETAFVKLGWLLGNYNKEKSKEMLPKNLVGEINDRINYDEFLV